MIDPLTIPKAELHLHIEGTLEPEEIFAAADRNGIALAYRDVDALRAAYRFSNLQSFLDLYYAGVSVLRTEADFERLARCYFRRAAAQGVRYVEMFFDPQAHTSRGVPFETVIDGLWSAMLSGERDFGVRAALILCFLRDLTEESAMETLDIALRYDERIIGVGLDSAEVGNPPEKFARAFARARAHGWHAVAHAGEEGPPEYIAQALDVLGVERIDHGVRILEDSQLVERAARERIPLTVCPLSNVRLRVVPALSEHPLKRMMDAGLLCTVNSDDPAYFGGYCGEVLAQTSQALALSDDDVLLLARNSFEASFLAPAERARYAQLVPERTRTLQP